MSAQSDDAARRERQAARALGTTRVHRKRGQRAPDVKLVQLPSGATLQAECKSRKRLPALLTGALSQARRYASGAIGCAVVFQKGTRRGLACFDLADVADLLGLDVTALPAPRPLRRERPSLQLSLFPGAA